MLNFKDWKLESSDGEKATLMHAKGHKMTIAMMELPKIQREQIARLPKVKQYDEGTPDTVNTAPDEGPPQPDVEEPNLANSFASQPVKVKDVVVREPVPNIDPITGQPNPTAEMQNSQEAVKDKANIAAAQAAASVPVEKQYIGARGETLQTDQDLTKQMAGHVDDFNDYVQKHPIDPNAYIENKGTFGKTLTGLGLILGGAGAGQLGSTDNPALRFLNNQIDRDIAGQQARVNNQKTILGAYRDLYGDSIAANNLTKASLLDIYNHKAKQIAAQLGTPTANAVAKELGVASAIEKAKLIRDGAVNLNSIPGTRPTSFSANGQPGNGSMLAGTGPTSSPQIDRAKELLSNNSPVLAGIPSSGSTQEKPKISPLDTIGDNNQILDPNAQEKLTDLNSFNPSADTTAIQKAHDQAFDVDQQLKQVNGLYKRLFGETNGASGRMHRSINPHAIAAATGAIGTGAGLLYGPPGAIAGGTVGAGLGEGLGHGLKELTNTGKNQEYDADLETLKGFISAGLKNRGDMTVDEAVQKFAPTERDTEEQALKKREAFKEFIVDHVDKGGLARHGMLLKKK
jgi:hypothetical protein